MRTAPSVPTSALPVGFSLPRSLAIAVAVTLHLGLAAMLAMPIAAPEVDVPETAPVNVAYLPPRPPPPVPLPPPPREVRSVAPARQAPMLSPAVTVPAPPSTPLTTTDAPTPLDSVAADTGVEAEGFEAGPAEETLQLRTSTPPRYPASALSRRLEGEVELLILVGIDGRPETVTVTRSSGHGVLDRAAREHVLRRWVFEPSLRNGIAVPAYARVPVRFTLP